ncbi:10531_t:CDS:2 [Diversispora eburnea]|uniref:10531_t:CDS:1 n=1 Tax=Diversispora eburnea TaxID=1213867 RepID=A0A9N9D638_9GLOM|nr:10531_t:CDS:2 [Diversispora eburnea]
MSGSILGENGPGRRINPKKNYGINRRKLRIFKGNRKRNRKIPEETFEQIEEEMNLERLQEIKLRLCVKCLIPRLQERELYKGITIEGVVRDRDFEENLELELGLVKNGGVNVTIGDEGIIINEGGKNEGIWESYQK